MKANSKIVNHSPVIGKKIAREIKHRITIAAEALDCDKEMLDDVGDLLDFKIDNRIGSMYDIIRKAVLKELGDRCFRVE